jgi:hypothetical protein
VNPVVDPVVNPPVVNPPVVNPPVVNPVVKPAARPLPATPKPAPPVAAKPAPPVAKPVARPLPATPKPAPVVAKPAPVVAKPAPAVAVLPPPPAAPAPGFFARIMGALGLGALPPAPAKNVLTGSTIDRPVNTSDDLYEMTPLDVYKYNVEHVYRYDDAADSAYAKYTYDILAKLLQHYQKLDWLPNNTNPNEVNAVLNRLLDQQNVPFQQEHVYNSLLRTRQLPNVEKIIPESDVSTILGDYNALLARNAGRS